MPNQNVDLSNDEKPKEHVGVNNPTHIDAGSINVYAAPPHTATSTTTEHNDPKSQTTDANHSLANPESGDKPTEKIGKDSLFMAPPEQMTNIKAAEYARTSNVGETPQKATYKIDGQDKQGYVGYNKESKEWEFKTTAKDGGMEKYVIDKTQEFHGIPSGSMEKLSADGKPTGEKVSARLTNYIDKPVTASEIHTEKPFGKPDEKALDDITNKSNDKTIEKNTVNLPGTEDKTPAIKDQSQKPETVIQEQPQKVEPQVVKEQSDKVVLIQQKDIQQIDGDRTVDINSGGKVDRIVDQTSGDKTIETNVGDQGGMGSDSSNGPLPNADASLDDESTKREGDHHQVEDDARRAAEAAALVNAMDNQAQDASDQSEVVSVDEKVPKKDPERRRKYIVGERDTLESIASKILGDIRLAPLILEINGSTISVRDQNGKRLIDLCPKLVIFLPTTTEIKDFRARLFSGSQKFEYVQDLHGLQGLKTGIDGQPLSPEEELVSMFGGKVEDYRIDQADAAEEAKRANIESLLGKISGDKNDSGRIKYTVRIGDDLKSVARKHPALQDAELWQLLAEINNLSTTIDAKDILIARIKRGSVIEIPSSTEIAAYREQFQPGVNVPKMVVPMVSEEKPDLTQQFFAGLSKGAKTTPKIVAATDVAAATESVKLKDDIEDNFTKDQLQNFVEQLGDSCRLLKSTDAVGGDGAQKHRLEILRDNEWMPMVMYEIYDDVSLRHEFTINGQRKTVRINLIPDAVHELAETDLHMNWQEYCEKFLAGHALSD